MAPPPLHPSSPSLNILPSNQSAVSHTSPPLASPTVATVRSPLIGFIKPPCLEKNHLSFPKYLVLKLLKPFLNRVQCLVSLETILVSEVVLVH